MSDEFGRLLKHASEAEPQFRLIGRRDVRSLNSWMHNSNRLVRSQSPTLLMHPHDARRLALADGAMVTIRSKSGVIDVVLQISAEVLPGVVSYPHGWGHEAGFGERTLLAAQT